MRDPYAEENGVPIPTPLGTLRVEAFSQGEPIPAVSISIDQINAASTPYTGSLTVGPHVIVLHHPWYIGIRRDVNIVEGQETVISVELEEDNRPIEAPHPVVQTTRRTVREVGGPLALGLSSAVLVGAGVFVVMYEGLCTRSFADGSCKVRSRMEPAFGWTTVGIGAAGIVGSILWYALSGREVVEVATGVQLTLSPQFIGLEGSF